ncbi:MAG: MATE family efflux transporter, partial [Pygmaiobacter sp.]
ISAAFQGQTGSATSGIQEQTQVEQANQSLAHMMGNFKRGRTLVGELLMSMLVQALYNVVDSYFVAKISESALTAVSLVFPIQNLLIAVAVGTGVGLNSLISRRLGERNQAEADSAAAHGLLIGLLNWLFFAMIGIFFSHIFFAMFTSNADVIAMGQSYMQIVCIGSIGCCVSINIEKTLQATGDMIHPMISQLLGALTNIILDPVFIFGLGPVPKMGVAGAAVATILGQILSMIYLTVILFVKEHGVNVRIPGFRPKLSVIRSIYAVGFPAIIMQSIGSVMVVGMNAILIAFSETAVAFFGIYFKLQSFVFMPVFGLNQGLLPIIGFNYGARNRHRVTDTVKWGCVIALVIMTAGTALFWIAPTELLDIFSASEQMLLIGVPALRTISLCYIPAAIGIVFSSTFQALGKGFSSLFISILRQLVIILPVALALAVFVGDLDVVWYAFPFAEIIASVV